KFANEDLSYYEVEKRIGFTHGTIRKWARRYGIRLRSGQLKEKDAERNDRFFQKNLNETNFLSRRWAMMEE
ncbi:MAG: hypothetical protein EBX40_06770, partial [Gammaproteobacteria bacterium]|nr:hypothetical protein [Gammaproteobacteria bacterium]